ncbi:MAG: aminoglycoside phosphotransferase family protein [Acidobacteriota bacterium]|jgi:hypothetical protein|nr:aminoglycoside phosphotransferase family protein [Acidobacteriota bacterium]
MTDATDTFDPRAELREAAALSARFDIPALGEVCDFPRKGNINRRTYLVTVGASPSPDAPGRPAAYLLQQLNPSVFRRPQAVMEAMVACVAAQEAALRELSDADRRRWGGGWELLRLVPTREGKPFLEVPAEEGGGGGATCWRMVNYIPATRAYRSLGEVADPSARLRVAQEAGRGLGIFHRLTERMPADAAVPLPGYRDTAGYYGQLEAVLQGCRTEEDAAAFLPGDATLRVACAPLYRVHLPPEEHRRRRGCGEVRRLARLALGQKSYACSLNRALASGELATTFVHGDPKLENFLFDDVTGRVKALVDLDTVMPHSWLSDWGDMVRSLTNAAGEREPDPALVRFDDEAFRALRRGYLATAEPEGGEAAWMADAPPIMALELGVRFLADYLRGDTYFAPEPDAPPDLNLVRARVQFQMFENLRRHVAIPPRR